MKDLELEPNPNADEEVGKTPVKGYLVAAALPGGLLLALGSRYVLRCTEGSEVYQRDAPETLDALRWLQGAGFSIAALSVIAIIWGMRKAFWESRK